MEKFLKQTIWNQFGAAIDALKNAINNCPGELWGDRTRRAEYWYIAYHTLFWLDYYLTDQDEKYSPPPPFGLEELDPAGVIPERPYTKDELLSYLEHDRKKCRRKIESLTAESSEKIYKFGKVNLTIAELMLYNMRHVQHHTAQLNYILREMHDISSKWIFKAKDSLEIG